MPISTAEMEPSLISAQTPALFILLAAIIIVYGLDLYRHFRHVVQSIKYVFMAEFAACYLSTILLVTGQDAVLF